MEPRTGPTQTPPTDSGWYTVVGVVTGPPSSGSSSATLTIYNPVPTIASITPSSGPDFGGTPITITGTNFRPGASVTIGGIAAGGVWVNATTITAVTPSITVPGTAIVVVSNPSPALDVVSATFTYVAYPQITSLSPTYGTAGTVVTITGRNFSASDVAVWFGAQAAAVSSRSATQIVAVVPPGLSSGLVDVTVSNVAQGSSTTYPRVFTVGTSPSSAVTVAAVGNAFACAVIGGGVKCWGGNSSGQLGDGTTTIRSTPGDVVGLTSGVAAVTAGSSHACALTTNGGVKCWGSNSYGQLGDGTTTNRLTPVDVVGLGTGVTALAAGGYDTCALTTGGGVKCWGDNSYGELGDGTTTNRMTPVDVSGLTSEVVGLAVGTFHTCAIMSGGGVKCWGYNYYGQLGDATTTNRLTPVDVSGLTSGVVAVAAGYYHTCAVIGGSVECWGYNYYGQLGDGTATDASTPALVAGLGSQASAVTAGYYHTCALTTVGGVKCWGINNYGELGDRTPTDRGTPGDVTGLGSGVAAVTSGPAALGTCAVMTDGGLKCWGSNYNGQLGDGSILTRGVPVDVTGLAGGTTVLAGGTYHTCAVAGGGVKCWGYNYYGQLGSGTLAYISIPGDVSGLASGASSVAAGSYHACAVTSGGGVKCWGYNYYGQLGDGTTTQRTTSVDVNGLGSGIVSIAAGSSHTCALTTTGGVKCWGYNSNGQLGDGTTTQRTTAVDVSGLGSGIVSIAAGSSHTCALTSAGGVKCWGYNYYGQLGDGTTTQRTTPVDVSGLGSGIVSIAAGSSHTCALTSGGGMKCWGYNSYGQLGDGTTTSHSTPADVSGLTSGVAAVASGYYHTCAVLAGGGVQCWGYNNYGQLGDGTTTNRSTPGDVAGLASGTTSVAGGAYHTCAIVAGGGVKCWGYDAYGQLGDGRLVFSTVPLDVTGHGKTMASVSLDGLSQVYDGTPRAVTVTTTPGGLAVVVTYTGVGATTYAQSTTPPTEVGTYFVVASVNDSTYQGTSNGTLTVSIPIGNPTPAITSLNPTSVIAGAAGFTLAVTGTQFVQGASVMWNGVARTTTFVSATELQATITAADVATAGTAAVSVQNPGGATSAPATFTIRPLTPIVVVGGDFNGDGSADLAIFRPSTGEWWVRGQNQPIRLGAVSDVPVIGDYNGDGRTEAAMFHPATGEWLIQGQATAIQWGRSGDLPVPGDYNGDGTTELAVYRRSTGDWFVRGQETVHWGLSGDVPVPGDYNGDGTTEIAIYRPSTGEWWVRGPGGRGAVGHARRYPAALRLQRGRPRRDRGVSAVHGGMVHQDARRRDVGTVGRRGDVPVPLDINGDGKTESSSIDPRRACGT